MWDELKLKLPKKVKWASDGIEGEGVLYDMDISETYVEFMINDPSIREPFSLCSSREFLGANGDVNGLRISARYMGEIVVLPDKKEGREKMEDKTTVVTMRVIDLANPVPGTGTRPCDECGELTWISGLWKYKKIDQVVCKPCWLTKYKNRDYVACTNEETIQQALDVLRGRGINVTREEMIEKLEIEIGKEIKIT